MTHAFVIGGTRFIGRHLVEELLDHGYTVTLYNRGNHDNPFSANDRVSHIEGDRRAPDQLAHAAETAEPDVVFDCVAYFPADVRTATDIFQDVDAYVYISSGGAYGKEVIPKREGETPLCSCSADQATADRPETYGNRKAEGDRAVFEAAADGVAAMSVRPPIVYGPHDYTERLDWWIDRVRQYDRIILPGDGTNLWHLVYVETVANALRIVAEEGTPGEAYNVGDWRLRTLEELIRDIADVLDTEVDIIHSSERELSVADIQLDDYVLYRSYPHVLDTAKLASLSWEPVAVEVATKRAVADHLESDRTGADNGPNREQEERLLDVLDTV